MKRRVAIVTGSRADFGLLLPVMRAVGDHPALELRVVTAGAHFLLPAETWREVGAAGFGEGPRVEMQHPGETGRLADAAATGRGIEGFARAFAELTPGWVVVLGDRIEAFAAATAGSIAGVAVAHLHGGDRAEGIADESLRHAITKLAHIHFAATSQSAHRILRMGEPPEFVHVVGSPAVDGLARVEPMSDEAARAWNDPAAVVLMHPSGLDENAERSLVRGMLAAIGRVLKNRSVLLFEPNFDPGRETVLEEVRAFAATHPSSRLVEHLARGRFLSLLKRLAEQSGVMIGNSSAGLIEAAALRLPAVNVGPRQAGRERPDNVIDAERGDQVAAAIERALRLPRQNLTHPYGDGRAGERTAALLADLDPRAPALLRKRCAY